MSVDHITPTDRRTTAGRDILKAGRFLARAIDLRHVPALNTRARRAKMTRGPIPNCDPAAAFPNGVPAMRKLLLSLACLGFMAGLTCAAEVMLLKYDVEKKEVTVKDGDAEKTYKITDKTKVSVIDKDGTAKEATLEAAIKVLSNDKTKGKKIDIATDKNAVTELKIKARRGKN